MKFKSAIMIKTKETARRQDYDTLTPDLTGHLWYQGARLS